MVSPQALTETSAGLSYQNRAAERALRILTCFSEQQPTLSLKEVAAQVELPKSTAFKLVQVLERLGFLVEDPDTGRYHVGPVAYQVGKLYLARMDLVYAARPILRSLADRFRLIVNLASFDRGQIVHVTSEEPSTPFRVLVYPGFRPEFHCSSIGKALLAYFSPDLMDTILDQQGLAKRTPNTITDRDELKAHLRGVRQRGYAVDNEEGMQGLRCVGAAVFDHRGKPVGAISMSGPAFEIPLRAFEEYGTEVKHAADEISAKLGYTGTVDESPLVHGGDASPSDGA